MASNGQRITDGQVDFSGGANSGRSPIIASATNPLGLPRNQVAWLENATVRGGGIYPRTGYNRIVSEFAGDTGLFQGGFMYQPLGQVPYLVMAISGRIYRANVWTDGAVSIIDGGLLMPATQTKFYFLQAEEFLIIQAGQFGVGAPLPLIWDGNTMRRSNGITGNLVAPNINEIPAGAAMDYYMGRIWVQVGAREYSAGDIVYGPSGTPAYAGRDAILKWTENAYLAGGGVFNVPSNAGSIRAIAHPANMDTALGVGPLIIFTRDAIYSLDVPVNRTAWLASGTANGNNLPAQKVVQNRYGAVSDRSVVAVNSDLFYKAYDGIRSLQWAIRYFHQWGQTPLSHNENRVLQLEDRAYISFASGILFDNRLLQTVLPFQTPVGVAFQGIIPLDFDLLTSLQEKLPPAWEGMNEGLDYMQLFQAESGGLERAFTVVHSQDTGKIQVWEMTNAQKFEVDDKRVKWYVEFPSFTWNDLFKQKKLDTAEIEIDNLVGTTDFTLYYRVDSGCWKLWHAWRKCAARNTCEDEISPVCYPSTNYCAGYAKMRMPIPPVECAQQGGKPSNYGFRFQLKLEVKGWCRITSVILHALPVMEETFDNLVC